MNTKNESRVLLTGCSTGIGAQVLQKLLDANYSTVAVFRIETPETKSLTHAQLTKVYCDLSDPDAVNAMLLNLVNEKLPFSAVIHNAGYAQAGPILDVPNLALARQFQVNVLSINQINAAISNYMPDHSKIIMIGSVLGFVPGPGRAAYSMTKYALEAYSDTLRYELSDRKIAVTLIQPGPVITKFNSNLIASLNNIETRSRNLLAKSIYDGLQRRYSKNQQTPSFAIYSSQRCAEIVIKALRNNKPPQRIQVTPAASIAWKLKKILPHSLFLKLVMRL